MSMLYTIINFVVEFIKLYLAVVVLFRIRQHKSVRISFWAVLLALAFASAFFDVSQFSFISGVAAIGILSVNAYEKKKAGIIVLSFLGISIVDMIFASVCIVVFRLEQNIFSRNILLDLALNLFSLVLLLVACFIISRKREDYQFLQIKRYLALYLFGGVALSLYLTAVQFMGMGESRLVYGKALIIGMSLSSLVLVVICVLLVIKSNQNDYLKREAEINASLLEVQKVYYTMLLEKDNETRAFRHDIKKHLYCMHTLYNNKKYDELGQYLSAMDEGVEELSPRIQTGNSLVTAIANDISKKFPEVHLQWTGMIPEELQISSLDICTIFYNLLSNAFEAVQRNQENEVDVNIRFMESAMMLTIRNPIRQEPQMAHGDFVTSKSEAGHGYGLKNIQKCVEKNGGQYSVACNGFFVTEIIIPKALPQVG